MLCKSLSLCVISSNRMSEEYKLLAFSHIISAKIHITLKNLNLPSKLVFPKKSFKYCFTSPDMDVFLSIKNCARPCNNQLYTYHK